MSKKSAILTIDIGLTNTKVSLFDLDGQLACQESERYPTTIEKPNWSEQAPESWWIAICDCMNKMLVNPAMQDREVISISVTAHMHGMIAIDSSGHPLTNCMTLYDRRATVEAGELNRQMGPRTAYDLTGGTSRALYTGSKNFLAEA